MIADLKLATLIFASANFAATALATESASILPANFPAQRYEALTARSPFTLATPPAAPAPPADKGFADGWYVTSLARLDGKDFVSIKSRDGGTQFSLFGAEPKDGIALQKVEWSPSVGRSTVTIVKDGLPAKLEFNQAEVAAQPQPVPVQQNQIRPGGPNAIPRLGGPSPIQRPVVPRPVQPLVQQQQGINGGMPGLPNVNPNIPRPGIPNASGTGVISNSGNVQAGDGRRRIRVIQNNVPAQ